MADDLQLTLANDLGELARVSEVVNAFLEGRGVARKVVYATDLVLEEVLSNVIRHGYEDGSRHEIALAVGTDGTKVELQVVDDGRAFDPGSAPVPHSDLPLASRPTGGLGLQLLRTYVTEIRYERVGGRNRLWLRL